MSEDSELKDALARMTDIELAGFCRHLKRETRKAQSLLAKALKEVKNRKRRKA